MLRLIACIAFALLPALAVAETRVALVVGNGEYLNAPALPNPANDANDVSTMLAGLGFDVTTAIDVDSREFDQALAGFSSKVEGADVAVFYYAGHGLQFDNENYLVPVDARLENEFAVRRETTELRAVLALMESARISLVFLDACRNNPLAEELARSLNQLGRSAALGQGLAPPPSTGRDVLIAFAAAPDQVAFDGAERNSPFTSAILKHLPTPDIEISTALKRVTQAVRETTGGKQLPQQLSDMATEFYMTRAVAAEPSEPDATPVPDPEAVAFNAATNANTVEAWTAFLDAFPQSTYAGAARVSLAALASTSSPTPPSTSTPATEVLKVRFGTEGAFPPWNFLDSNGNVAGFEVDLGNELCTRAGLDCEWTVNDWDTMIPDLKAKQFDAILAGMAITEERVAEIDFTAMYRPPDPSRFVGLSGESFDFADLNSTRIGVLRSTIQHDYLRENFDRRANSINDFLTFGGMLRELRSGALHLIFADEAELAAAMASEPDFDFKGPPILVGGGVGIGLRKEDDELEARLNAALSSMKQDGSLDALITQWFEGRSPLFGGVAE
jgi:ABC-type amino acid transport substrate-binding protein